MIFPVLLALALGDFAQLESLPSEKECEVLFKQAEQNERDLGTIIELAGHAWPYESMRDELSRQKRFFWALWWATWERATWEQRMEHLYHARRVQWEWQEEGR